MSVQMEVDPGFFRDHAEALEDIARTGYWPTTYVSGETPELPLHHHDHDMISYVIEGSTYLIDADGVRVEIGPGDRLRLPSGAKHAEGEATDRVVWIVSTRDPVPFIEAVMPRDPQGPMPDLSGR